MINNDCHGAECSTCSFSKTWWTNSVSRNECCTRQPCQTTASGLFPAVRVDSKFVHQASTIHPIKNASLIVISAKSWQRELLTTEYKRQQTVYSLSCLYYCYVTETKNRQYQHAVTWCRHVFLQCFVYCKMRTLWKHFFYKNEPGRLILWEKIISTSKNLIPFCKIKLELRKRIKI